jgi:hypothetical protein
MNILIMKYKIVALTSLLVITANVKATPTNEELYGMILDLKKEVSESKTREKDLHANLDKANAELGAAKKQLGALPKTELIVTAVKQLDEIKKDEPPKIPNIKEGFSVSAGALYVKPISNSNLEDKVNYDPGFQVSTNYQAKNNWDYALNFKRFQSTTNFSDVYDYTAYTSTSNYKSTLNYNVLDLEIGKLITFSDNTSLRISGGLRSAIIDQKLSNYTTRSSGFGSDYYESDSNFWGLGPRITADPTWKPFGNNFRVFGSVASSFLMGQRNYTFNNEVYNDSTRNNNFVTMLEAGTGLGYTIKTNSADIDLKTGYQLEKWMNQNNTDYFNTQNDIFSGYHGAYGTVAVKY